VHETRLGIRHVQVVEHQAATGLQCRGDVLNDGELIRWIVEIAKAREQVQDVVERA
jgi:hypothetical protein